MKVHGREVRFLRSVMANCKVLEMAPEGDMERFNNEMLGSDDYEVSQRACARLIAILSEAHEQAAEYESPGSGERPLTVDEALSLPPEDFSMLFSEAIRAWQGEKPTVEESTKKPGKKTEKR